MIARTPNIILHFLRHSLTLGYWGNFISNLGCLYEVLHGSQRLRSCLLLELLLLETLQLKLLLLVVVVARVVAVVPVTLAVASAVVAVVVPAQQPTRAELPWPSVQILAVQR